MPRIMRGIATRTGYFARCEVGMPLSRTSPARLAMRSEIAEEQWLLPLRTDLTSNTSKPKEFESCGNSPPARREENEALAKSLFQSPTLTDHARRARPAFFVFFPTFFTPALMATFFVVTFFFWRVF